MPRECAGDRWHRERPGGTRTSHGGILTIYIDYLEGFSGKKELVHSRGERALSKESLSWTTSTPQTSWVPSRTAASSSQSRYPECLAKLAAEAGDEMVRRRRLRVAAT